MRLTRRLHVRIIGIVALACSGVVTVALAPQASGTTQAVIAKGDLAVSIGSEVDEYTPSGTLVQKLITSADGLAYATGSAFDGNGNLYVTDFSGNKILRRDALTGAVSVLADNSTLGNGHVFNSPESIVFNKGYTKMYISGADRSGSGGGINVVDTATGHGVGFYPLTSSVGSLSTGESDWLASDANSNLYMTNENPNQGVMKVDQTSGDIVQPSFISNLPSDGYGLSFDKNGNLWVGDTNSILEYSPAGAPIQTISNPNFGTVFAAVFNAGGDQFYAGDLSSGDVFTYDLNGTLVRSFTAGAGVSGLSVSGAFVPPNVPGLGRYVALGDSYSSGEGNPRFITGTDTKADHCHRSNQAYGPLVRTDFSVAAKDFVFKACSGAVLPDLIQSFVDGTAQYNEGAQIDAIAPANSPSMSTGLVTVSIGGNDAGFPDVLQACVSGLAHPNGEAHCLASVKEHLTAATKLLTQGGTILLDTDHNTFTSCDKACVATYSVVDKQIPDFALQIVRAPNLAGLYQQIHKRAPNAKIRVLLYPHLFATTPPAHCNVGSFHGIGHTTSYYIDAKEMIALNKAGDTIDQAIADQVTAAKRAGINIDTFDPRADFAKGHEICDGTDIAANNPNRWLNGLVLNGAFLFDVSPFSFHPTSAGQADFADRLEASL